MSNWKTYKLKDLVSIRYGKDHKHLSDGNIPVYGSGGVMRYASDYLYDGESILIPRKGTLSNLFYLNKPFWSVDTMFYTQIKDLVFPKFLYYYLKGQNLASLNVGSAVPSLTTEVLNKFLVTIPEEIKTQQQIAQILSSLDDKIEFNLQMNQTLESMAKAIFKEWFVDFNFPGFDGKLMNGLPNGWQIAELNEIISFVVDNRGKTPPIIEKEKEGIPLIEVNALLNSPVIAQRHLAKKFVDEKTYTNWFRKGHPKKGDVLFSTVGSIGEIAISFGEQICIAQNIVALRSKFKGFFLYFSLKSIKQNLLSLDISSVQPSIKVPHLLQQEIIFPTDDIINEFEIIIAPLLERMFENEEEIRTLTQTRDTLLPKLMSGQLEIQA